MDTKNVLVEFTGLSRVLTGQVEQSLCLSASAELHDVVQAISDKYPALVGEVIESDERSLIPTNLFSINGEQILHEGQLQYIPNDGDRLILWSLLAGG